MKMVHVQIDRDVASYSLRFTLRIGDRYWSSFVDEYALTAEPGILLGRMMEELIRSAMRDLERDIREKTIAALPSALKLKADSVNSVGPLLGDIMGTFGRARIRRMDRKVIRSHMADMLGSVVKGVLRRRRASMIGMAYVSRTMWSVLKRERYIAAMRALEGVLEPYRDERVARFAQLELT